MKVTFTKYTGAYPEQRIPAIKELRNASGLTLMDSKRVVDHLFEKISVVAYINKNTLEKCHEAGFLTLENSIDVIESLKETVKKCIDIELFEEAANISKILQNMDTK